MPPCLRQRRCRRWSRASISPAEARPRIGADPARVLAEDRARRPRRRRARPRAARRAAPKRGVELRERQGEVVRHGREAFDDGAVARVEHVLAPRGRREEPLGALEALAQDAQLLVLTDDRARAFELAELEAQQILTLGPPAHVGREALERPPRLGERLERRRHLGARGLVLREGVEDLELAARIGERLLIVLRGDVDEPRDVLREVACRREPAARRCARPRPVREITRRTTRPSSRSAPRPSSSSPARAEPRAGREMMASTRASSRPTRMTSAPARAPRSRPMASTMMLLPAPVSPVMTVRPGPSARSTSSMSAKPEMWRWVSMVVSGELNLNRLGRAVCCFETGRLEPQGRARHP